MTKTTVFFWHRQPNFLISINKNDLSKDNIKSETKDMITSQTPNGMVRNVKQDNKGNILIASYKGLFQYDAKSFTNLKIILPASGMYWKIKKGNPRLEIRDSNVYHYNGRSFEYFKTKEGLANTGLPLFLQIK